MSFSKTTVLLAAALLTFAAANAPLAAAQNAAVEACVAEAEAKFQKTIATAATQLTASTTLCQAASIIPASSSSTDTAPAVEAAATPPRPGCGRGCQYGLCVARCYIDRIRWGDMCRVAFYAVAYRIQQKQHSQHQQLSLIVAGLWFCAILLIIHNAATLRLHAIIIIYGYMPCGTRLCAERYCCA
jgi:hypothetical protein